MAAEQEHPRIKLTPDAVARLRVWMRARGIKGTAEELLGGMVAAGGVEVITDAVIDEIMANIDNLRTLHGHRWFEVLQSRSRDTKRGTPPIEPRNN